MRRCRSGRNLSKLVQVRGTAQTLDCIKGIAKKQEDATVSGVLQQFFKRYLERDASEKIGGKSRIVCRVDYVTWAKLQTRAKQKNISLSSLCMNILEEQMIEYKKNEMRHVGKPNK
ncbi:MAG: hypothetical protein LE169_06010 [Endomicrobium sp.]|nr:hypothetical protein [Endomicrobium sp.]